MPRTIPADLQASLESGSAPDALLAFLTIQHSGLAEPVRVVSDWADYIWDGHTYTGLIFGFELLTDTDEPPSARLRVQNVDRRIGKALEGATERAQLALSLLSSADFDLSVNPRTEIGTPAEVYAFRHFELTDVKANAIELTGKISLRDFAQEPWPRLRATQELLPGLYR